MQKKTREDRIYIAYKAHRKALEKEVGLDRIHARTLLYLAETFSLSPLTIQKIVAERSTKTK